MGRGPRRLPCCDYRFLAPSVGSWSSSWRVEGKIAGILWMRERMNMREKEEKEEIERENDGIVSLIRSVKRRERERV